MTQVLCLDLVAKFVVDLALERQYVITELQVHDLRLRLRLEYSPQVFEVLDLTVEQQLAVGELVVLIACDILLDLKRDTTGGLKGLMRLLCFNDEEFSSLDDLELPGLDGVVVDEEFELCVIQYVEPLEEEFARALHLQDFHLLIQDAFRRQKLAEPTRLQVEHVGRVVLEDIEKSDLRTSHKSMRVT